MGRFGNTDYADMTKAGFLLGLGLFVLGTGGEILGNTMYSTLPAWENTLFLSLEGLGILIGFFSVWVFGVYMPLTE